MEIDFLNLFTILLISLNGGIGISNCLRLLTLTPPIIPFLFDENIE